MEHHSRLGLPASINLILKIPPTDMFTGEPNMDLIENLFPGDSWLCHIDNESSPSRSGEVAQNAYYFCREPEFGFQYPRQVAYKYL